MLPGRHRAAAERRPIARRTAAGIAVDSRGDVIVDEFGRTTAPGVWALGDVNGRHQLKHMANGEAKVVRHNVMHPDDLGSTTTGPHRTRCSAARRSVRSV